MLSTCLPVYADTELDRDGLPRVSSAFTPRPPEADSVKDADLALTRKWLDFHAEPIAFEEQVLASIAGLASGLSSKCAPEQMSNLTPIRKEVDQLRVRGAAWLRRRQELES